MDDQHALESESARRSEAPKVSALDDRPGTPSPEEGPREARADSRGADRSESVAQRNRGKKIKEEAPKRSKVPLMVLGVVMVVAVLGGTYHWYTTKDLVDTDDAFIDGHAATIAPQVSGNVVTLAVDDNQFVHEGDLLIQIDPRDYQAARDEATGALAVAQAQLLDATEALAKARVAFPAQLQSAQAQLQSTQANLVNAQADYRRFHTMDRAAVTQQNVDNSTAALRQAEAQVQQAQAQLLQAQLVSQNIAQAEAQVKQLQGQVQKAQAELDRAELNLSYTRVVAPSDGWVTKRGVELGNYVQAGSAILSLVAPQFWVTANFKETELTRMRPGQQVSIEVDAYPDLKLRGHVDSIQMGSGSKFTAFPAENATGNFVKIVQRVPVKILIDRGLPTHFPLPLGISVTPTVYFK